MKFKVGEIVEVRSVVGRYEGWEEDEIIQVYPMGLKMSNSTPGHYRFTDRTLANEADVRRKKPHQSADQWQVADEDFLDDLKGLLPIREDEMVKLHDAMTKELEE